MLKHQTNYLAETAIAILKALKSHIIAQKGEKLYDITNQAELIGWLEYTRERSKLNIGEFAAQIGVSRNQIGNYISGKTKIKIDTLLAWANITGYTISICAPLHPDII